MRCDFMTWKMVAETLAPQEEELRGTMSEHVGRLMKGKCILLVTEMAEALGWPDMSLFDEMVEGFELVGMAYYQRLQTWDDFSFA